MLRFARHYSMAAAACVLLAATGCGAGTPSTLPGDQDAVEIGDFSGEEMMPGSDGGGRDFPAGYPPELAYPSAQVETSQWLRAGEAGAGSVTLTTDDSVPKAAAYYRMAFQANAWSLVANPLAEAADGAETAILAAGKGSLNCTVMVLSSNRTADEGKTTITVAVEYE